MRSSDGSSDVGASDLGAGHPAAHARAARALPPGWLYPPPSRRSLGSPLSISRARQTRAVRHRIARRRRRIGGRGRECRSLFQRSLSLALPRSEEHTSELQSLMRISYAVFCLNKKTIKKEIKKTES